MLFSGNAFTVEGITVNRTRGGGDIEQHAKEAERIVTLAGLRRRFTVTRGASGSFEEIAPHLNQRDLCFLRIRHGGSAAPRARLNTYREAIKTMGLTTQVNIARRSARSTYFTESAGTILMLSTVTRFVGLLRSPLSLVVTSVSPIFPRTSSPFMIFPNVVYW